MTGFRRRQTHILGIALILLVLDAGCGGGGSGAGSGTTTSTNNPVPAITSLSPSSATAGAAAQTLTVNGTNFLSTSTITFNAVAHTATYVGATQLTISLSASDQATAGSYGVVVTNPTPGGGASNSEKFTVSNTVPTISSISPTSATAGAAAQTLTINGTNFLSTSTVTFNAVAHTATYVSATKLTISLSASDEATGGSYAVVVTNPAPGGGASNSVNFTVNSAESVTIGTTSLPSGTVGTAYTSTTLSATGGTAPYTWSITAGALPLGLTLSSEGEISGTPLAIDTPSFTVEATDASSPHLSGTRELSITVNASSTVHNGITVSGSNVTGINLSLSSMTTTLGLADVGSCGSPNPSGECLASVTGIQISRSGAATSSCPNASCTVWLLGRGLSDTGGTTVSAGLTVVVSQGSTSDVSVSSVEAGPVTSGLTAIRLSVKVSATAALGNRNIFVTLPDGETQAYLGGIQIVE